MLWFRRNGFALSWGRLWPRIQRISGHSCSRLKRVKSGLLSGWERRHTLSPPSVTPALANHGGLCAHTYSTIPLCPFLFDSGTSASWRGNGGENNVNDDGQEAAPSLSSLLFCSCDLKLLLTGSSRKERDHVVSMLSKYLNCVSSAEWENQAAELCSTVHNVTYFMATPLVELRQQRRKEVAVALLLRSK